MTDLATIKDDAAKVVAWYKSHLFYAGCIAGAVVALIVRHFV